MTKRPTTFALAVLAMVAVWAVGVTQAQFHAQDPGVRGGPPAAGGFLPGLTADQQTFFLDGKDDFEEAEGVADGLGPRFNLDGCGGCHAQPATGGTSPAVNPQVALATAFGAQNTVPSFITLDGPVREVRFPQNPDGTPDGGVHALYVVSGRVDGTGNASACTAVQEDFAAQAAAHNVIFRIPTPMFGGGLMEMIPDSELQANLDASTAAGASLGVHGHHNRITGSGNHNGNDGTIARFGWKAQNKSLLLFSGEAYNVEMGISNELFQTERDENGTCQFAPVPNDVTNTAGVAPLDAISAIEKFAIFARFLAAPEPSLTTPGGVTSIANGRALFDSTGCALCHTPTLHTGDTAVTALAHQDVPLYSDLAVHAMGPALADHVAQGQAAGDEFRTAPLWGLGQRIFFLHDGRTSDLVEAIAAHKSGHGNGANRASEANAVVDNFTQLSEPQKQDLLNFLRSL